jgi:aminoglycoside phosphotransferase (APT) family kinase protein
MQREYTIYEALQETPVPVPTTLLYCEDTSVIGTPFFLMDRIYGDVLEFDEPTGYEDGASREAVSQQVIDTLAAIHTVDYEAVGLSSLGDPDGFVERQVDRWTKQLTWCLEKDIHDRSVPTLNRLQSWLRENIPPKSANSLVHGDYKLNNFMFQDPSDPDLAAVFDWEMGTLGDPLTDLGWLLCYWWDPKDPPNETPMYTPDLPRRDGYLSRKELVARYEGRTGITFEHEQFYRALGIYKMAVIGEMFYVRYLQGETSDPFFEKMTTYVPALGKRGVRIIEGNEPL